MKHHHLVLGLALAGLFATAVAWAQTVVVGSAIATRPDGGTQEWFPNDGHTVVRQRDGSKASVDRQGTVTDFTPAPSCQNPGRPNPAAGQRECRKGADGKIRGYVVHYVTYTCDNDPRVRRLITAFVETPAGAPCTEEDYARDQKAASSTWGETWTVPNQTAQKKGKGVAKKVPGKQPSRTVEDSGGGGGQINIGIGIGGGGGERGRREREKRREREGGGGSLGTFR